MIWFAQNGAAADDKLVLPRLATTIRWCASSPSAACGCCGRVRATTRSTRSWRRGRASSQHADLAAAIATYSEVIRRKPAFAEGWNKRATAYFLNDELKRSLADCDQVMKRNPYHFGALSGYGQIYFQQKQYDKAIEYWQRARRSIRTSGLPANIDLARKRLATPASRRHSHSLTASPSSLCRRLLRASACRAGARSMPRHRARRQRCDPGPLPLFPADNWWNPDISSAPVDPNSASYINFIGGTRQLHPDFGGEASPGSVSDLRHAVRVVDGTSRSRR